MLINAIATALKKNLHLKVYISVDGFHCSSFTNQTSDGTQWMLAVPSCGCGLIVLRYFSTLSLCFMNNTRFRKNGSHFPITIANDPHNMYNCCR